MEKTYLSIVIPVFNEEASLVPLYGKIKDVFSSYNRSLEIILVDDGSTDGSSAVLAQLASLDGRIKIVSFETNRGQHKAFMAGFQKAEGQIIVTLDSDLQDEPEEIFKLLAKMEDGFDLVCGWRWMRNDSWHKVLKSNIANFFQRRITKISLHDMGCSLRAYRSELAKKICLRHRHEVGFIPYFLSCFTDKITEVKVKHNKRVFGKSKYHVLSQTVGVLFCYLKVMHGRLGCDRHPVVETI